jgi:FAD/FMN-containing dehydrogenase
MVYGAGEDATPPGFPAGITVARKRFGNWAGEVVTEPLWTAAPVTAEEVAVIVRWAHGAGYAVRPRGYMHNWAPFTVAAGTSTQTKVVLVDTTGLDAIVLRHGSPTAVRVGAGASMQALLEHLHEHGHGLVSVPSVGEITVGGALAVGSHGAAVPARGEDPAPGEAYGSMSNLVLSFTAVVWDAAVGAYVLRTFNRTDPEAAHLLTHLGRTFITEVVLQVGPARNLRCRSTVRVSADRVFAAPEVAGDDSFGALLERSGRVESILFPFAKAPWTKVWSVCPEQPPRARATQGPYNYPFSDRLPKALCSLMGRILRRPSVTPLLGRVERAAVVVGLAACAGKDLWGPAHHTQLYVRPTTFRQAECGIVVLTSREDVQWVVSEVAAKFEEVLADERAAGRFPINGPLEVRATGLDRIGEVVVRGATAPTLSALHPREDHPEWDTAVWVNLLTAPGTDGSGACFAEMEAWARRTFSGARAGVRAEWSKGWAHTAAGPWSDAEALETTIPDDHRVGRGIGEDFDAAQGALQAFDPHRRFASPLLDRLLPERVTTGVGRGPSR